MDCRLAAEYFGGGESFMPCKPARPLRELRTLAVAVFAGMASTSCQSRPEGLGELASRTEAITTIVINVTANQIGRQTWMGNGLMRTFNQYDALGRATAAQHVLDAVSYVYQSAYGYPQN